MWTIVKWSREAGRGRIRPDTGSELEFDASVALVGDFRVGEEVHVELERAADSWRVARIWPDDPRFKPAAKPTQRAAPMSSPSENAAREAVRSMAGSETLSVLAFTPELLIIQGTEASAYSPGPELLICRQPLYLELAPVLDLKSCRLATEFERDHLASRSGCVSPEAIAVTIVDTEDRFHFIVASEFTYQARPKRAGA